jgi:hypothetical protein
VELLEELLVSTQVGGLDPAGTRTHIFARKIELVTKHGAKFCYFWLKFSISRNNYHYWLVTWRGKTSGEWGYQLTAMKIL